MEYIWALFAIGALVTVWLWDFIKKLVLSKWWDKDVFLLICFFMYVPAFWINMYFQWTWLYDYATIKAACIIGATNFWIPIGLMTALKYLNVSFAFVFIRVISSFLVLFIWLYILWDNLSIYNILWFFLGAFAIFLLSWFKIWQKLDLHPKGLIAAVIATLSIVFGNSYYKYMIEDVQVHDYTALQFTITGTLIFLYMIMRKKVKKISWSQVKRVFPYSLITVCIFMVFFLYLIPNMYLLWTLSLSYKMLSYSLIVPILLSIIFLWEAVNKTRIIAFVLTIISIFLFLI